MNSCLRANPPKGGDAKLTDLRRKLRWLGCQRVVCFHFKVCHGVYFFKQTKATCPLERQVFLWFC